MLLVKSYYFVKHILMAYRQNSVVIGTGGFVSAPVVFAARALKIPVYLINTDTVPGKANRLLARYAKKVFVQFEQSAAGTVAWQPLNCKPSQGVADAVP
jgi:UDP-N-acetylglucosamine--N-acetylmuramyl-(pentapeptide) pyrophosphoryl-undecaprenol N-acetylglucosamine transferase